MGRAQLLTVGHGTLAADELATLLREAEVAALVDVRRYPGSRRHPQFGRDAMAEWVPAAGLAYRWEERLGGRRPTRPDSPNVALRNEAFRGYADYMATGEFTAALDQLVAEAALRRTAVMCAESLWWRCHRRLLSDAAQLTRDVDVHHLLHDGRLAPHRLTDGVRLTDDGTLTYDLGIDQPLPL